MVKYGQSRYSQTSMARTSLGQWEFLLKIGSSSHCGLVIAQGQGGNLGPFTNAFEFL